MLDELAKADSELAEEIRLLLFTFEDVVKLDDRSIQMVLKEVDQKDLAIALRGVNEDVRGADLLEHVRARRRAAAARRSTSSRRSASASSRRRRAASSASCAASRRPARSSSPAARGRRGRAGLDEPGRRIRLRDAGAAGSAAGAGLRRPTAVMDVLAEARAEAEQLRQAARDEGYAAGPRRGARVARAGARRAGAGGRRACAPQQAATRRASSSAGPSSSGWRWPQKVVAGALGRRARAGLEAVQGALRGIVERERITVLVNPDDLEIVREAMDGLRASLGGIEHCEVQAERRVGRGGVHRAHARGRRRRARRDQARARGRSRRRRARPLDDLRAQLPIRPRCSR